MTIHSFPNSKAGIKLGVIVSWVQDSKRDVEGDLERKRGMKKKERREGEREKKRKGRRKERKKCLSIEYNPHEEYCFDHCCIFKYLKHKGCSTNIYTVYFTTL